MSDKTPKADALRAMRERDAGKVGPFRVAVPKKRPKRRREVDERPVLTKR